MKGRRHFQILFGGLMQKRQQLILNVSINLFYQNGVMNVSLEEIAQQVGVTKWISISFSRRENGTRVWSHKWNAGIFGWIFRHFKEAEGGILSDYDQGRAFDTVKCEAAKRFSATLQHAKSPPLRWRLDSQIISGWEQMPIRNHRLIIDSCWKSWFLMR